MEESELHEVLQHTMANVNGKAYRTMVNQLFSQNTSPVMDYTYDIDLHKVLGNCPGQHTDTLDQTPQT
jgi:translation initiation factor 2-alpha kinase 4